MSAVGIAECRQRRRDLVQNHRVVDGGRDAIFDPVRDLLDRAAQDLAGARLGQPRHDRRSEEHTSELQSRLHLVCRLLLEKKKKKKLRKPMITSSKWRATRSRN